MEDKIEDQNFRPINGDLYEIKYSYPKGLCPRTDHQKVIEGVIDIIERSSGKVVLSFYIGQEFMKYVNKHPELLG